MLIFLTRLLYLPLFLLLGNGLAITIVSSGWPRVWLAVLVVAFVVVAFMAEHLLPYDAAFNQPQNDRSRDFIHGLVNEGSSVVGLVLLPSVAGAVPNAGLWPAGWPLWQQTILAVLLADIGITLVHYASHRVGALWRLHAVHHSVRRMYGLNGLMKHPLHQFLETLGGVAPLLLLGVPHQILQLLVVAVALQLLLQHSNVAYFTGPLKYVFAVNVVHRFHHLNSAKEGDVNFGLFTSLTDRLLGTAFYDADRRIGRGDLGIEGEINYPTGYLDQLIQPFRGAAKEPQLQDAG